MTRDGAIPVTSHVHAGNRPDVTQFAGVLDELTSRYATLFTSGGDDDGGDGPTWAAPTVVLTHSGTLHTAQSRGKTRRHHTAVLAAMSAITHPRWVTRVMTTELTGTTPASLRLTWRIDPAARKTLETELFGKRLRVTDQDHWTEAKIRVHVVYCVLALAAAHIMRRQAHQVGLDLSVRELLTTLGGIQETVLLYPTGNKG